jgi:hypothetical protein
VMVKGLLFSVPLISYFQNRTEEHALRRQFSKRITTNSQSSPGRGEMPRPDEPSAWNVRFINLDRRLTSDWDLAEGVKLSHSRLVAGNSARNRRSRATSRRSRQLVKLLNCGHSQVEFLAGRLAPP